VYVPLPELPLTPNGKIDRLSLPAPDRLRPNLESTYQAPGEETEAGLAQLWSSALGIPAIGVHDDFFELGGNSLLASAILAVVRQRFGVRLPLRAFFELPTVSGLARRIRTAPRVEGDGDERA
jgi:hypothetical protein